MGEEPLAGGRNAREVVRVGDTVRRAAEPGSAFAARVLGYLEASGYAYAPRYLGVDSRGRESRGDMLLSTLYDYLTATGADTASIVVTVHGRRIELDLGSLRGRPETATH